MSWLSYCYKTYQNSVSEIGKQQPGKVPLLPVAHTTQQVNIEVELDKDGNFQYAGLLAQDQGQRSFLAQRNLRRGHPAWCRTR